MAVANVGIADYKIIKSPDQIMTVGLELLYMMR